MILVFDTETTGKVDFYMPTDHECQPHLVQLAALLADDDGTERACVSVLVRPDGWQIPEGAAAIHGITTETATRCGVTLQTACAVFDRLVRLADTLVAHNISFDHAVLATAWQRCLHDKIDAVIGEKRLFCTMKAMTPVCKIPHAQPRRPDDWKWPKLTECIKHLFNEELAGAHDALNDVRATKRVYFKLMEKPA